MRLAGTRSWRLSAGNSQSCELALFARDTAQLPIVGGDVPALIGAAAAVMPMVDAVTRQAAGEQWRSWWQQILDFEVRDRLNRVGGDARGRVRQVLVELQAVCDPPDFDALADRSALRAVVHAAFDDFRRWESARGSARPGGGQESPLEWSVMKLEWSVMKQVAEDVAFDRGVRLDAVRARVVLLPVQGMWWHRQAPGAVLCSPEAARDPMTSYAVLHDAFDSYVTRAQ